MPLPLATHPSSYSKPDSTGIQPRVTWCNDDHASYSDTRYLFRYSLLLICSDSFAAYKINLGPISRDLNSRYPGQGNFIVLSKSPRLTKTEKCK